MALACTLRRQGANRGMGARRTRRTKRTTRTTRTKRTTRTTITTITTGTTRTRRTRRTKRTTRTTRTMTTTRPISKNQENYENHLRASLDVYLVIYVSFIQFSMTSVVRFLHRGQAHDLSDNQLECLVIEITRPHSRPFLVSTWYRPPSSSQDIFSRFEILVDKIDSKKTKISTCWEI